MVFSSHRVAADGTVPKASQWSVTAFLLRGCQTTPRTTAGALFVFCKSWNNEGKKQFARPKERCKVNVILELILWKWGCKTLTVLLCVRVRFGAPSSFFCDERETSIPPVLSVWKFPTPSGTSLIVRRVCVLVRFKDWVCCSLPSYAVNCFMN